MKIPFFVPKIFLNVCLKFEWNCILQFCLNTKTQMIYKKKIKQTVEIFPNCQIKLCMFDVNIYSNNKCSLFSDQTYMLLRLSSFYADLCKRFYVHDCMHILGKLQMRLLLKIISCLLNIFWQFVSSGCCHIGIYTIFPIFISEN